MEQNLSNSMLATKSIHELSYPFIGPHTVNYNYLLTCIYVTRLLFGGSLKLLFTVPFLNSNRNDQSVVFELYQPVEIENSSNFLPSGRLPNWYLKAARNVYPTVICSIPVANLQCYILCKFGSNSDKRIHSENSFVSIWK